MAERICSETAKDESSADWQTSKATVRDRTTFLFNNPIMSDVKFVLTDSDGTQVRVPAHKLVLAMSSPVFEAMFYGGLAENREEIALLDTESTCLLEFLRSLYCDEVGLTTDNVFSVLYLAQKYMVPLLADKCWSFIDSNTCACLKSDKAVSTLNHEILTSLAKRDALQLTREVDLFEAMKHWAEGRCKAEGLEPGGEAMRRALGDVRVLIRWSAMSVQDFTQHVLPAGILTDKEALDIYASYSLATPGRKRKFRDIYRAGTISSAVLHECHRECRDTSVGPRCVREIHECLDFVVETRNVQLKGIRLITGMECSKATVLANNSNAMFTVDVRVLDQDKQELAAKTCYTQEEKTEDHSGCKNCYGTVIEFEEPVLIWRVLEYTLEVKLKGVDDQTALSKIKRRCYGWAVGADVRFRFRGICNYIDKLLFYKLD